MPREINSGLWIKPGRSRISSVRPATSRSKIAGARWGCWTTGATTSGPGSSTTSRSHDSAGSSAGRSGAPSLPDVLPLVLVLLHELGHRGVLHLVHGEAVGLERAAAAHVVPPPWPPRAGRIS